MTVDDIWRPPASTSLGGGRRRWAWVTGAVGALLLVAALTAAISQVDLPRTGTTRPLPSTFEEAERQQGTKVLIEQGTSPDGRTYSFTVSRSVYGDLCHFLLLTGDRGGGGGGGCGSADPIGFSMGSEGGVHGVTSAEVATVELGTPAGAVRLPTKQLPAPFSKNRYFLTVLPSGSSASRLVARDADGKVLKEQKLPRPWRTQR